MSLFSTELSKVRKFFVLFAVLVMAAALPAVVWAAKGDLENIRMDEVTESPPLYITLGKAELVDVGGDVADVLVADPTKVDVTAIQSNRLYVVGLAVGDTNLIALDANGDVLKKIDLHVKYDLKAIQSLVDSLFPGESAQVGSVHDQIILTGTVSTPEKASKIANVVGHYVSDLQDEDGKEIDELISNLMEVRGEQQVMLQVKVVEANRSVLKELGVETRLNDGDELSTTTLFGNTPPTSVENIHDSSVGLGTDIGLTEDPLAIAALLADTGIAGIGNIGVFLSALEEENLVNVLAEPNLTAVSGQQAGFLAGGEFPVPVGRDNVGNIVIEFREFGVSLNFKPVVLSDKRINLQLNTEVSSLDFENAVTLADLTVPGLDIRRADTTVEIPSGGSLMIAGLLQSEAVKGMAGLPGIRKTPVLGDLVSSDSFQRNETELVVIVTPYLVEPYAEKERADPAPKHASNPLAKAFAANVRRAFDIKDENEIFADEDENFGYLLD
jgi:pilus assembly protein CpaC